MKNIWLITAIIIVIVIVGIIAAVLIYQNPNMMVNKQASQSNQNNQQANNPGTNNQQQNQGTSATPKTYGVTIKNFAFSPATMTIKAGDSVTWTNMDSVQHTVTSDSGAELNSALLSTEATYSHTFSTAGTYNYHCSIHTTMHGTIIVQ